MELEKKITDTFNSIREKYGTDVFGFQELYYRTNYKKGNTLGGLRYERKNK